PAADQDVWRVTPQNYLEKIFQIPFSLRPMTSDGYTKLIDGLMKRTPAASVHQQHHETPHLLPVLPDRQPPADKGSEAKPASEDRETAPPPADTLTSPKPPDQTAGSTEKKKKP